jgi:anthranilate phosphoribosyltransferase
MGAGLISTSVFGLHKNRGAFYTSAVLESLTNLLAAGQSLDRDQVQSAVQALISESVPVASKAEFLRRLAVKGESIEEITAFVEELRARAIQPPIPDSLRVHPLLDVVGTGGDRLSTFNISTTVAILCAAAGVRVAKHGNRASTSTIGSADVIEALGIPFDLTPEQSAARLQEHGFAFFFAPKYHPAFRHIIPARKLCAECGQSTIFNFLGPLLNPAQPSAMLVGVPRPDLCESLARVLQVLGVRRAMVVCGQVRDGAGELRHLDELSPLGSTTITEFYQPDGLNTSALAAEQFPIQRLKLEDLRGGDRQANARIIREVLAGTERGPKRDAVLLNAAAALFVAERASTLSEGWQVAEHVIDSGAAREKLNQLAAKPS